MVRTVAAGGHAVEVSGVRPEVGVGSVAYLQAADRDVLHRRLLAAGDLCSRCNLRLQKEGAKGAAALTLKSTLALVATNFSSPVGGEVELKK